MVRWETIRDWEGDVVGVSEIEGGQLICQIQKYAKRGEEFGAIISAAPDMLHALELLQRMLDPGELAAHKIIRDTLDNVRTVR